MATANNILYINKEALLITVTASRTIMLKMILKAPKRLLEEQEILVIFHGYFPCSIKGILEICPLGLIFDVQSKAC